MPRNTDAAAKEVIAPPESRVSEVLGHRQVTESERERNRRTDPKLAYGAPRIQSAVIHGDLPADVVAEWNGVLSRDRGDAPETGPQTIAPYSADCALRPGGLSRPRWSWGTATDSLSRRAGVGEYLMGDEALLFDPQTQSLHYLNETALAIWRRCDGRNIQELATALNGTYEVDGGLALDHVTMIVDALAAAGLLSPETDI